MANKYSVLVVDDEQPILRLLEKEFSTEDREIETASTAQEAREKLARKMFDVIVLDIRLPDADGLELFEEFKGRIPDVEIVLITGHGDIDSAVVAMRMGAYDYIPKPFALDRLELVMDRAFQRVCLQRENRGLRLSQGEDNLFGRLIGKSKAIKQILYLVEKVAPTDVPVLLTGESGVGKDVVARAIHDRSNRATEPLIIKNCATLQRELMRSELFGHAKGSFTGATESQEGLIAYANKGSLFLDEIGDLPLEVQASLLRVLEAKKYRRIGGKEERQADIRFLFATNRNLAAAVEDGEFNEALFHRINVFKIEIPPLRERKEDIPLLVEHFLGRLSPRADSAAISEKAMGCLLSYNWPGNVRELRNVLERSLILAENGLVTESSLPKELVDRPHTENQTDQGFAANTLESMEKDHILHMLSLYGGNRQKTAQALGIGRKTLYRKLEKYGL